MKLRLATAVGLVLLLTASLVMAADTVELPKDLQELLPVDPAILFTCTSVEELDASWLEIQEAFADEDDEEPLDLLAWMREEFEEFDAAIDPARPMAVALDMGPVMMGQEPYVTLVMPLNAEFADRESLLEDDGETTTLIQGDYLVFNTSYCYHPACVIPAIAQDMVPGVLNVVIDLEGLLLTYRPFVEMGLASIPVGIATTDTLPSGEVVVTDEGMTQEEADALAVMIRALMDSVDRMDMGVGAGDSKIRFDMQLTTLPGTPLSPGPMPDFADALALSGLLPGSGDFLMAIAMDMTPQFDVFKDFYILNMQRESEKMGADIGPKYAAWFEDYLGMIDLWSKPLAGSYGFSTEGMVAHAAMASDDAQADADRLVALLEGMSNVGMGVSLTPLPGADVDGVAVRSWKIDIDPETMTGLSGSVAEPELSAMGRMQADQLAAMMKKIVPGLSIAVQGNHVLLSADDDPTAMAGMIAAAAKGGADPNEDLAKVAKAAGPGVQEVVTGDMMAILNWVSGFMEEAGDEDWEVIKDNPIPFNGVYTINGEKLGFAMNMDMPALKNLIRAFDEMDLDEDMKGYSDETEEEVEEKMEEEEEG